MSSPIEDTMAQIELKLTLNVILGELDEAMADAWKEALRSLSNAEVTELMRAARRLPSSRVSMYIIRYLMEKNYPFREMVLYDTDDDFKRRVGLGSYDY